MIGMMIARPPDFPESGSVLYKKAVALVTNAVNEYGRSPDQLDQAYQIEPCLEARTGIVCAMLELGMIDDAGLAQIRVQIPQGLSRDEQALKGYMLSFLVYSAAYLLRNPSAEFDELRERAAKFLESENRA